MGEISNSLRKTHIAVNDRSVSPCYGTPTFRSRLAAWWTKANSKALGFAPEWRVGLRRTTPLVVAAFHEMAEQPYAALRLVPMRSVSHYYCRLCFLALLAFSLTGYSTELTLEIDHQHAHETTVDSSTAMALCCHLAAPIGRQRWTGLLVLFCLCWPICRSWNPGLTPPNTVLTTQV